MTTVFEATQWGEQRISDAFYASLAKALGATLDTSERGHGYARMTLGELSFTFRQGYGAKARKMSASVYAADSEASARAYRAGRPVKFPEAMLDPTRPLDALAKDVQRRLIEKAQPGLQSIRDLDAAALAHTSDLQQQAACLTKRFPVLSVTVGDHSADVYGRGVSATMSRDGTLYMRNLSLSPEKARRVLAILLAAD